MFEIRIIPKLCPPSPPASESVCVGGGGNVPPGPMVAPPMAVDPTEIPSSGGGPHGPRLQPFVLLVGPEHVLLRLRTRTT